MVGLPPQNSLYVSFKALSGEPPESALFSLSNTISASTLRTGTVSRDEEVGRGALTTLSLA